MLQTVVRAEADKLLAPNAAEQTNRQGNLFVAVTYPTPLGVGPAETKLVSQFADRSDLLDAFDASTYIPYWSGPLLTTRCAAGLQQATAWPRGCMLAAQALEELFWGVLRFADPL